MLDVLAKLQLSAPVLLDASPSRLSALWKSPKSAKPSNEELSLSSSENDVGKVKGSEPLAAAESENGPNAS